MMIATQVWKNIDSDNKSYVLGYHLDPVWDSLSELHFSKRKRITSSHSKALLSRSSCQTMS